MSSGMLVSHSNSQARHELAQTTKIISVPGRWTKKNSHWMHQFPWVLIFIFVYYCSTQCDAALQSHTMSYTMTSKCVLTQYFADVLHLLWIPGGLKRNKKKKKNRGGEKSEKKLPIPLELTDPEVLSLLKTPDDSAVSGRLNALNLQT